MIVISIVWMKTGGEGTRGDGKYTKQLPCRAKCACVSYLRTKIGTHERNTFLSGHFTVYY